MSAFLLLPFLFFQSATDSQILAIRNNVVYTNHHLHEYKFKQIDHPEGISTEGGVTTAYWSKDSLKLITDETYGETGKLVEQYYFENGQLIFAYFIEYDYNVPFYMKDFSFDKSLRHEDRYYLDNQIIIKWIDEQGKTHINPQMDKNDLLIDARKLMALF